MVLIMKRKATHSRRSCWRGAICGPKSRTSTPARMLSAGTMNMAVMRMKKAPTLGRVTWRG